MSRKQFLGKAIDQIKLAMMTLDVTSNEDAFSQEVNDIYFELRRIVDRIVALKNWK